MLKIQLLHLKSDFITLKSVEGLAALIMCITLCESVVTRTRSIHSTIHLAFNNCCMTSLVVRMERNAARALCIFYVEGVARTL